MSKKPLTLSEVTNWLVINGYCKLDADETVAGIIQYRGCSQRHWTLEQLGDGGLYLTITPHSETAPSTEGANFGDMYLILRIQDDNRVGLVELCQSYTGESFAGTISSPCTTAELKELLMESMKAFKSYAEALGHPP